MKPDGIHGAIRTIPILGPLLLVFAFVVSGCVWVPDFTNPSLHRELKDPLAASIVKSIPFSITRTVRFEREGLNKVEVEFGWEQEGRAVWLEGLGFGTKAEKWRFVLFGPDRKEIICKTDWYDATPTTSKTCTITKEQLAVPLNAYINFQFPGDEKDEFKTVGRPFYFVNPGK